MRYIELLHKNLKRQELFLLQSHKISCNHCMLLMLLEMCLDHVYVCVCNMHPLLLFIYSSVMLWLVSYFLKNCCVVCCRMSGYPCLVSVSMLLRAVHSFLEDKITVGKGDARFPKWKGSLKLSRFHC